MDTITHVFFSGLTIRSLAPQKSRTTGSLTNKEILIVASIAGAFPDIDYLMFWINPLRFLAEWHRTFTHSLILAPLWGAVLTIIMILAFSGLRRNVTVVYIYCVIGLLSHILLDVLTVYGTAIFYPFSERSFSLALAFVIDPYITLIIAITLIISLSIYQRFFAVTGILLLLLYLSFQWHMKQEALSITRAVGGSLIKHDSVIQALPQPFSPFHWRIIIKNGDDYDTALLDIAGISEKFIRPGNDNNWSGLISAFHSPANLDWEHYSLSGNSNESLSMVNDVWWQEDFRLFRQFAVFPVLYRIDSVNKGICIWFSDMRYFISTLIPPFRYGMCRTTDDDQWKLYRLKRFTENQMQQIAP